MPQTLLLWLTISTASMRLAPPIPPWPGELPTAQTNSSGTFLPRPLDLEITKRMMLLDQYPEICQAEIDKITEEQDEWAPRIQVFAAIGGALALGFLGGYALGK